MEENGKKEESGSNHMSITWGDKCSLQGWERGRKDPSVVRAPETGGRPFGVLAGREPV